MRPVVDLGLQRCQCPQFSDKQNTCCGPEGWSQPCGPSLSMRKAFALTDHRGKAPETPPAHGKVTFPSGFGVHQVLAAFSSHCGCESGRGPCLGTSCSSSVMDMGMVK